MSAYGALEQAFRRAALLGEAVTLLHWDMSVVMPPGGAGARGEQLAALKVLRHGMLTDPRLAGLLDEAEAEAAPLDPWQAANLREMRRKWVHANAVPADLVEALSKACSTSEMVWRTARRDSDFTALLPSLRVVLDLTREAGAAKAAALGCSVYDALLDQYEAGGRCDRIDALFDDYAAFLPNFLEAVLARQAAEPEPAAPTGPFPVAAQRALCCRMAEAIGFDFHSGRLDESLHPFSGGVPEDSRITTRYDEADFAQALMGVLHETGHAMYERSRPRDWRYQPVGEARGMALHESQSLIVEMQACRSREFFQWAAPILRRAFDGGGPDWDADNLYRLHSRVERSFIRVDADEVTYPAHVILRYRLERGLISGELDIADLPGAWNEGMRDLLGIVPPNDRLGCLQDIHWPDGEWGYFPTYSMGAMAAAQLFQAARRDRPDILPAIGRGDFRPLMAWLGAHVHSLGSLYSTDELLQRATGAPLGAEAFKAHLQVRYLNGV